MKREQFKPKHDHNFTDWLKFIIFAVLMMAPFFSIGAKCLYVICNKNAKDSYYGETINEEQINILDDLDNQEGKLIYFNNDGLIEPSIPVSASDNYITISNLKIVEKGDLNDTHINELLNCYRIGFYHVLNNSYLSFLLFDENTYTTFSSSLKFTISFNLISCVASDTNSLFDVYINKPFYTIQYNKYSYLDNVFDYACEELKTSNVFNWTQQTATYSVFNNMLTGLTIQNGILPLLLTYWMMLIVIYIIVDIIIKLFTLITHMIN